MPGPQIVHCRPVADRVPGGVPAQRPTADGRAAWWPVEPVQAGVVHAGRFVEALPFELGKRLPGDQLRRGGKQRVRCRASYATSLAGLEQSVLVTNDAQRVLVGPDPLGFRLRQLSDP